MTQPTEFKKIDATGYRGLAKAHIEQYNRNVKDLARENRLGRGDEGYAQNLISAEIPKVQKLAVAEMAMQDLKHGRVTDPANIGGVE